MYYNFCYSANILKIRSCGFDLAQYCTLNQAYYPTVLCNPKMELFPKIISGFRCELRILPNIYNEAFFKKGSK